MDTNKDTKLSTVEVMPFAWLKMRAAVRLRAGLTQDAIIRGKVIAEQAKPLIERDIKARREKENITRVRVGDNVLERLQAQVEATEAELQAIYEEINESIPEDQRIFTTVQA